MREYYRTLHLGNKFAKLTVIDVYSKQSPNAKPGKPKSYAVCECECGEQPTIRLDAVTSGKVVCCKKCTYKIRSEEYKGSGNHQFTGIGTLGSARVSQIKRDAKKRDIPFDLTIEYLWKLFESQNEKCQLSGIKLSFGPVRSTTTTASLDRIDSGIGYIEGNVQWVHKDINMMKGTIPNDFFIELCKKVASESYNEW